METSDRPTAVSRRGCLGLLLAGFAFIVLVLAALVYIMTRPQDGEIKANEQRAIVQCWERAKDSQRSFTTDSCKEMEKQFTRKFGHAP